MGPYPNPILLGILIVVDVVVVTILVAQVFQINMLIIIKYASLGMAALCVIGLVYCIVQVIKLIRKK